MSDEDDGRISGYGSVDLGKVGQQELGNSVGLTAGLIISDVIGAGILSMAVAVANLGWLLGGLVSIACLVVNVHISILLWRAFMCFPKARSYEELAAAAFEGAPAWQQRWAPKAVCILQGLYMFSMLSMFVLIMGKCLGMMFYDQHFCLPKWCFIACCLTLPLAVGGEKLGSWNVLIWLNSLILLGTIFIPLVFLARQGLENTRPPYSNFGAVAPDISPAGVLTSVGTFAFVMTSQAMLVEIMAEMRDPKELPRAYVNLSAPFQLLAFLAVGIGGYYFKGSAVAGMLNESLPFGFWFQIAALLLLIHMLVTYVIKNTVMCKSVIRQIAGTALAHIDERSLWLGVNLAVLFLAWLVSQLIPFFTDFVELLGASLTPLVCWVIPIILYVRCVHILTPGNERIHVVEWCVIGLELILSAVLSFIGPYLVVKRIHADWHAYGFPFDCHCEGIWATCECSQGHHGMEGLCPLP